MPTPEDSQVPRAYLAPDVIMSIATSQRQTNALLERAIDGRVTFVISKYALFEAFASLEPSDQFDATAVAVMFKAAELANDAFPKSAYVLTPSRKAQLRSNAFQGGS